ncbi:UBQ [Nesidiocoris tenuis]|uniref:UBQ n=1 Tax=Nesidiocoris tenuis TaxID=355587 RepID=A0ABN7AUM7_9HEMI|nr:UBQ [Nesidiocoris tenuis]
MTLIEGIGDEVTHFFSVVLILLMGVVAWWSTRTSDQHPIRTVLILERRAQTSDSNATRSALIISQPERGAGNLGNSVPTPDQQPREDDADSNLSPKTGAADSATATTSPEPESNATSNSAPCDKELVTRLISSDASADSGSQADNEPSACTGASPAAQMTTAAAESAEAEREGSQDDIRIRLKYLNDDQKLVQGKLHEHLGDFKKRHFSVELSGEKRIRLIFNGQVLQSDEQTLQGYGLYDNCVVHCLVHSQSQIPSGRPSAGNAANQTSTNNNATNTPEWNLGGLLYVSLSILLAFAWFLRYHYAQLFTLTTTTMLTGLTAMFAVSFVGMYMPDQEAPPA